MISLILLKLKYLVSSYRFTKETPPMLKDFEAIRNSKMNLNEVYFWTDTVLDWKKLLKQDKYKQRIIEEWQKLIVKRKIAIYAFVLMPNHLHVVWELLEKNGKEMPHASFNKATGHEIIKDLKENHPAVLNHFEVNENERQYRIWQRDPLAILMDNIHKVEQKINYIHNNPLQERWNLADNPENYKWSSARFYELGIDDFGFLTHYKERFG
jgi:putative transposase